MSQSHVLKRSSIMSSRLDKIEDHIITLEYEVEKLWKYLTGEDRGIEPLTKENNESNKHST
jgi:hypothetical protein